MSFCDASCGLTRLSTARGGERDGHSQKVTKRSHKRQRNVTEAMFGESSNYMAKSKSTRQSASPMTALQTIFVADERAGVMLPDTENFNRLRLQALRAQKSIEHRWRNSLNRHTTATLVFKPSLWCGDLKQSTPVRKTGREQVTVGALTKRICIGMGRSSLDATYSCESCRTTRVQTKTNRDTTQ